MSTTNSDETGTWPSPQIYNNRIAYEHTPVESALAQALRLRGIGWPSCEACKPDTAYRLFECEAVILEPKYIRELAYKQKIGYGLDNRLGGVGKHVGEMLYVSAWQYEVNRKIRLGSSYIAFGPDNGERTKVTLKGTLGYRFKALCQSFDVSRDNAFVRAEPGNDCVCEGIFWLSTASLDAIVKDLVVGILVYRNGAEPGSSPPQAPLVGYGRRGPGGG